MSCQVQRQCLACLLLILCQPLQADCKAKIINPFTDIAWHCIFPISLGGVVQLGSGDRAMEDKIESPICTCRNGPIPRIGLKVSFWELSRIIDTVATPYCIMPLGTQLKGPRKPGSLGRWPGQRRHRQRQGVPADALLPVPGLEAAQPVRGHSLSA